MIEQFTGKDWSTGTRAHIAAGSEPTAVPGEGWHFVIWNKDIGEEVGIRLDHKDAEKVIALLTRYLERTKTEEEVNCFHSCAKCGCNIISLTPLGECLPETACDCGRCLDKYRIEGFHHPHSGHLIACGQCGNKRCPKASSHEYACTGSNKPDQIPTMEEPKLGKGTCEHKIPRSKNRG